MRRKHASSKSISRPTMNHRRSAPKYVDLPADGDYEDEDEFIDREEEDEDNEEGFSDEEDEDEDEEGNFDDEDQEDDDDEDDDDKPLDLDIPEYFDDKTRKKILDIEQKNLSDKPWTLKGEVSGIKRPQNSLLDESLQFDCGVRAPKITEETSKTILDIIRERVKEGSYDDPVRKVKPHVKEKARVEISQEKSKLGLADVYAQEFAKSNNQNQEVPPEQTKIKMKLKSLFTRIDALLVYKE